MEFSKGPGWASKELHVVIPGEVVGMILFLNQVQVGQKPVYYYIILTKQALLIFIGNLWFPW